MSKKRSLIRQPFAGYSHMAGAILSVAALIAMLVMAQGRFWHIVGFTIFGASLILLYTSSTLYHSLHLSPNGISRLQRMDYIMIFVLISGTYAPVCLVPLRGALGWSLLGVEYGLALAGILLVAIWRGKPSWLRVALYIIMGWLAVTVMGPMSQVMPKGAVGWLLAGGILYSIGTVCYATERPCLWPGKFDAHDLWHCFVLGGSACHLVLMLAFIAKMG